jgi:hypothetical protein
MDQPAAVPCYCGHLKAEHPLTPHGAPCQAAGCYCQWYARDQANYGQAS